MSGALAEEGRGRGGPGGAAQGRRDFAWEPTRGPQLSLGRGEVHVWCVDPDQVRDPVLLDVYRGMLSGEERRRYDRTGIERVCHPWLIARVLVRTVLSRYAEVAPREWVFERTASGRPVLAAGSAGAWLRFSLSHTSGCVALLLARERDVGIDVEDVGRLLPATSIAEHCFARIEAAVLRAVPEHMRMRWFMERWTLKESYAKARGLALSQVLDQTAFAVGLHRSVRAWFDPRLGESPDRWQFALHETTAHVMGIAIERGHEPDLGIRIRRTVPLVS